MSEPFPRHTAGNVRFFGNFLVGLGLCCLSAPCLLSSGILTSSRQDHISVYVLMPLQGLVSIALGIWCFRISETKRRNLKDKEPL